MMPNGVFTPYPPPNGCPPARMWQDRQCASAARASPLTILEVATPRPTPRSLARQIFSNASFSPDFSLRLHSMLSQRVRWPEAENERRWFDIGKSGSAEVSAAADQLLRSHQLDCKRIQ